MQNISIIRSENGTHPKQKSTNAPITASELMKLFEDELTDIFWSEKELAKAIPNMIKNATSMELLDALIAYLGETYQQVERLAHVFESIEKKPGAKNCLVMEGLIKVAHEIMESCKAGAMCDIGIISAAQKVIHYEIVTYGTLFRYAEKLYLSEAITLLAATLEEEKAADQKFSEISTGNVNIDSAEIKAQIQAQ